MHPRHCIGCKQVGSKEFKGKVCLHADLVILGCGKRAQMVPPNLQTYFKQHKIAFEAIDTVCGPNDNDLQVCKLDRLITFGLLSGKLASGILSMTLLSCSCSRLMLCPHSTYSIRRGEK